MAYGFPQYREEDDDENYGQAIGGLLAQASAQPKPVQLPQIAEAQPKIATIPQNAIPGGGLPSAPQLPEMAAPPRPRMGWGQAAMQGAGNQGQGLSNQIGGALGGMLKERLLRTGDGDLGDGAKILGKGIGGGIGKGVGAIGGALGSAGSGIASLLGSLGGFI